MIAKFCYANFYVEVEVEVGLVPPRAPAKTKLVQNFIVSDVAVHTHKLPHCICLNASADTNLLNFSVFELNFKQKIHTFLLDMPRGCLESGAFS